MMPQKLNANWDNGFLSRGTLCKNTNQFPCVIEENSEHGFYSAYLEPRFRLITLNSVTFSLRRAHVSEKDALAQLTWLETQLQAASNNNESVLIAMHIPPGKNTYDDSAFWQAKEQAIFLKLIATYQDIIIGILSSHTHAEEMKIIQTASSQKSTGIYFTAGLSTSHGNEPSAKTFYFNKDNHEKWLLTDYQAWHFTKEAANITLNNLYNYQTYYCTSFTANINECLNNITSNKMQVYFSAGNKNFAGEIKFPDNILLDTLLSLTVF